MKKFIFITEENGEEVSRLEWVQPDVPEVRDIPSPWQIQPYRTESYNPCEKCSNNVINGGSGNCCCSIPQQTTTTSFDSKNFTYTIN